jgi:hypothetical protein
MATNFTALDLFVWHEEGSLQLSPKFQRRDVWKQAARSFFIDTLLRGFPIPPIHIRMAPGPLGQRPTREVIDGQQRLRALFDFISGKLTIARNLSSPWAGKTMGQLSDADRDRIRLAQFPVYQYQAIDDATVLEIFSRLNTYSVALTAQELRNGKYFGLFKTLAYSLAWQYLEFWRGGNVFSEASIARMAEVEFVSELLVMQLDGFQDKKASLDYFYAGLDQEWPNDPTPLPGRRGRPFEPSSWLSQAASENRFRATMATLVDVAGDLLRQTPFRRVPLLYSLYAVVYHAQYGLAGVTQPSFHRELLDSEKAAIREMLEQLSEVLISQRSEIVPGWQRDFAVAAARQTDNIGPRRVRFDIMWLRARLGNG